jgi:hypothetical protein
MKTQLLAFYIALWGIGFLIDPHLREHEVFSAIGLALLAGSLAFLDITVPSYSDIKAWADIKDELETPQFLALLVGLAAVIWILFYAAEKFFNSGFW